MVYYYQFLDKKALQKLIINAGRIGHHIRNQTQGYVNLSFPEIQVVDNLTGQLEAQCRQLQGHLHAQQQLKNNIRNTLRTSIFLKKLVNNIMPNYINQVAAFDQIKSLVNVFQSVLAQVDAFINNAIISQSQANGSTTLDKISAKSIDEACIKKVTEKFDRIDLKQYVCANADSGEEFKRKNLILAQRGCNYAHAIQQIAGKWIHTKGPNQFANKIIGSAGQIENQCRNMETQITNNFNGKGQKTKQNFLKDIQKICVNFEKPKNAITQVCQNQKCPLSLKKDQPQDNYFTDIQAIYEIVHNNMEIGFKQEIKV